MIITVKQSGKHDFIKQRLPLQNSRVSDQTDHSSLNHNSTVMVSELGKILKKKILIIDQDPTAMDHGSSNYGSQILELQEGSESGMTDENPDTSKLLGIGLKLKSGSKLFERSKSFSFFFFFFFYAAVQHQWFFTTAELMNS